MPSKGFQREMITATGPRSGRHRCGRALGGDVGGSPSVCDVHCVPRVGELLEGDACSGLHADR
eukprot:4612030-Pyramimonas_sp.AAC.1